jgi:lactate dehydrogenase-like 2-hydroxyacid dehydrogenase
MARSGRWRALERINLVLATERQADRFRRGVSFTRPAVLVTSRLPEQIEATLAAEYSIQDGDQQNHGAEALLAAIGEARAIVVIPGDPVDAKLIQHLPDQVGVIPSFSSGLDVVDVVAAQARGITVSNTPGVLTDATGDGA